MHTNTFLRGRNINRLMATAMGGALAAAVVWAGLSRPVGAAAAPDPITCLPTCGMDGRALVVAGNDDTTLAAVEIFFALQFTVAAGPDGNFEFFDGDADLTNWDTQYLSAGVSAPAPQLSVELFADPAGVGGSGLALHTWTPGAVNPVALPAPGEHGAFPTANNAFVGVVFPHDASARSGSNYRYAIHVTPANPAVDKGWNGFKVRAAGQVALLGNQVIAFLGAMNTANFDPVDSDLKRIYPHFFEAPMGSNLTDSPYDGTWTLSTILPFFLGDVTVFDGDMDYGDEACAYNDTDDPDTPAGIPSFASPATTVSEGVAQATGIASAKYCNYTDDTNGTRTGIPSDDNASPIWSRQPTTIGGLGIKYKLVAPPSASYPTGQIFVNENPSGNREWEQFKIQLVAPGDFPLGRCPAGGYPADAGKGYPESDCRTDELPGGQWDIVLEGMDLSNLNFWFFSFKVEPPSTDYAIGGLVWYDANENGAQDLCGPPPGTPCAPELGIDGVSYTVYDGPLPGGTIVRTGVTDVNGEFDETGLPAANYTVIIGTSNFNAGAPLEGLTSTTGGETEDGVEVGLPACTDTDVPIGCGEPTYAEAIFGYVLHSEECIIIPSDGGSPFIGAVHTLIPNPPGAPAGAMTIRTTLNKERFVDNTYGSNAIGWPSGNHKFSQLVGSDRLQLALYDAIGVKKLEFAMDYISASSSAPGGYTTLGVAGGDGRMYLGASSQIWAVDTSLSVNFRDPVMVPKLTVNSPPTNSSYAPPAAPYANWIFDVYYDVTFLTDVFGPGGFGYPRMSYVHASPSKTGSNSEICVYANERPIAVGDAYTTSRNHALVVSIPGVLGNDFGGDGGPLTAVLFASPTRGTLVGGLNADGSFTYSPKKDFTGGDKFTYQASNGNGLSTVATVAIKVTR